MKILNWNAFKKKRRYVFIVILVSLVLLTIVTGLVIMMKEEVTFMEGRETEVRYFKNPLNITGIGDPFVMRASDGKYYCYPTSSNTGYRVWFSEDMVNWSEVGHCYSVQEKSWGYKDFWAPEVVEYSGKYYMYYTARWSKNDSLRIGVAVSDAPTGPFTDVYDRPMFDFGYAAIDANVFIDDDGKKYLYFSRDCSENIVDGRNESHIYGIELNDDMISVKGEPVLLTKPDQEWEKLSGPQFYWNEGSLLLKNNGLYYLMYSANFYAKSSYSIGYATSTNPLGPFKKYDKNPIVSAEVNLEEISGPGHNSIALSPDKQEIYVVYHTHTDAMSGGGNRQVFIDRMGFRKDGTIYVNGPTIWKQPYPFFSGNIKNIAIDAKVAVSSTKAGYNKDAINDGEIGFYEKFQSNEWVSDSSDSKPSIKLNWDSKKRVSAVLVYGSSMSEKNVYSFDIILGDSSIIKDVKIPKNPGEAAILNFEAIETDFVEIRIKNNRNKDTAVSEIMILEKIK
jgi:beta-xylosidase